MGYLAILLYVVGLAGLALPATRAIFIKLTPWHLVLVSGMVFAQHKQERHLLVAYIVCAGLISFCLEALGVRFGWLFGSYSYGEGLGFSIMGVPVLIGLNWALLGYCAGGLIEPLDMALWQKVALSALLLVGFDACMEPSAVGLGFWHWPVGYVPGHNYLGWWLTALPVCGLRLVLLSGSRNFLVPYVWWSQFFFFFILSRFIFPSL